MIVDSGGEFEAMKVHRVFSWRDNRAVCGIAVSDLTRISEDGSGVDCLSCKRRSQFVPPKSDKVHRADARFDGRTVCGRKIMNWYRTSSDWDEVNCESCTRWRRLHDEEVKRENGV